MLLKHGKNWYNFTFVDKENSILKHLSLVFLPFLSCGFSTQSRDILILLSLSPPSRSEQCVQRKGVILMNDWIPHLIFQAWPSTLGRKLISSAHIHSLVLLVLICSLWTKVKMETYPHENKQLHLLAPLLFPLNRNVQCAHRWISS